MLPWRPVYFWQFSWVLLWSYISDQKQEKKEETVKPADDDIPVGFRQIEDDDIPF